MLQIFGYIYIRIYIDSNLSSQERIDYLHKNVQA